jgi:hypothetical protein
MTPKSLFLESAQAALCMTDSQIAHHKCSSRQLQIEGHSTKSQNSIPQNCSLNQKEGKPEKHACCCWHLECNPGIKQCAKMLMSIHCLKGVIGGF